MEIEGRDFMNTPPLKTVRFGGNVVATLAKFKQGDTSDYELLKHQLADPDIKDAQIINWLQEFRNCVTQLSKDHEQLIYVALRLPWLGRSPAVVEEYLSFLSNLVSAQTVYLRACLKMVVSNFKPSEFLPVCVDILITQYDLPRSFDQCHQALQLIGRYVPSTSCFLMPILIENFPFVQKSSRTLECYVHNLLRVAVYIPSLRRDVLELIISRMLKLDVSAPRGEIEDVEENAVQQELKGEQEEEGLFDMDEDVCSVNSSPAGTNVMVHPVAERLDTLMVVLLAFIKDMCHVNGCLDVERTKDLYKDLVCVFDKLILPTHASCHVQYALFYLCSFRLALAEAFLEHLWRLLQSPSHPAVLRQSAAGYMGSFLARANFLPVVTVRACLDLLVPWLHLYIDSQDSGSRAYCDITLHGPFYNACQAVFYTLIFRHRSILEGNMKKGRGLHMRFLSASKNVKWLFDPDVYPSIHRKYQLVFCYTIIERNNRHVLPVVRSSVGGDCVSTNTNPLDSFFPFDPYVLKRSSKLIEPLYQVWEEPCSDADEDDFLRGETPETKGVMGMTPGSYESHLHSPSSVGSPPISFLQRPYHH
uniref:RNA polymerase I-specific transcription initiation factor RRN3 n=1 Tax=Oncorhynchus mykiss TaxID=8022 RepID=A0A8C7PAQ3_ONCMY